MAYSPGTLFRIRNDTGRYTAVLMKNGKILEVKSSDTTEKTTYDTLEEWYNNHLVELSDVLIDISGSCGIIIGDDTNGWNYPLEEEYKNSWLTWCYQIIKEASPKLLDNDELKTFNNIEDAFRSMKTDCDKKNGSLLKQLFIDLFEQHPELKENLLGTGLRPLVFHSKIDKKYNLLYAKTLVELRNKYYMEM
jgi:hypothetical protein